MSEGVSEMASSTRLPFDIPAIRRSAEEAAQRVLRLHWPTGDVPVDPVKVARSVGVEVFSAQLGEDVYGMLAGTSANDCIIYLDRDQPPNRFRFSCAHELGHYAERFERPGVPDPASLPTSIAFVDRRSDSSRGDREEIYANHFAGALLMPANMLRAYESLTVDNFDLAAYFGVSPAAMTYRRQVAVR